MITLKEWMELVDCRITEGSDWYSSIPNLYSLTSWNGEQDGYSLNIVFDPKDGQRVYLVEVCDYKNNRAYRIKDNGIMSGDPDTDKQAWDDVDYVDLDVDEDFLDKARAIIAGEYYDTRVSITVDFSDEELLKYMTLAHERDMTFNQFIQFSIEEFLKNHREELSC